MRPRLVEEGKPIPQHDDPDDHSGRRDGPSSSFMQQEYQISHGSTTRTNNSINNDNRDRNQNDPVKDNTSSYTLSSKSQGSSLAQRSGNHHASTHSSLSTKLPS